MKNIKNLNPSEAVIFENEIEKLVLNEGVKVLIITDGTEFDKEILCSIYYATVNEIAYNDGENIVNIGWEYIEEISIVD